ncbi:hypothetical protein [Aurantimonas sp. VKM B-3413]|uniref:hypothetical protein n=1 Tax=Aurantimonas sp. VKM B-3413 TaxID=2779401 RepID=UPI001E40FED9|nr:hypothetical protein [Aurantimonas sp. VKM B-3413]MCB8837755.1 hypothetical protein [Aurantimonas sp. VKM B-3413]
MTGMGGPARYRARTWLLTRLAATFAWTALVAATPSLAESDINAILGNQPTEAPQAVQPPVQPGPAATVNSPQIGGETAGAPISRDGSDERWVKSDHPLRNLSVISVQPLPSETCQDVLFDIRPSTRVRHAPEIGGTIDFDLGQLCLLGIRNESDQRTVVVRVGDELRTIAIVSDSRLNSGMALGPGREILVPIRPLDIKALTILVDAVWDDQIDKDNPTVESFSIHVTHQSKPGS